MSERTTATTTITTELKKMYQMLNKQCTTDTKHTTIHTIRHITIQKIRQANNSLVKFNYS